VKLLEDNTDNQDDAENCAAQLMETVPFVMRALRYELRRERPADLSVPQFRALAFVRRHSGASLSEVAEHLGLTLPATSTLIDRLVERALLSRAPNPDNRRRLVLTLTDAGQAAWSLTHSDAQEHMAQRVADLSPADRAAVIHALQILRSIFASEDPLSDQEPTR
jgi:DNA-binding MarR family transcriptional regulator